MFITEEYISDVAERGFKTFAQFYFGSWIYLSGKAVEYDTLFTWVNVKAGVVGLALSLATSIGSKPITSPDSASLVK